MTTIIATKDRSYKDIQETEHELLVDEIRTRRVRD
jgi:hypothetical protein